METNIYNYKMADKKNVFDIIEGGNDSDYSDSDSDSGSEKKIKEGAESDSDAGDSDIDSDIEEDEDEDAIENTFESENENYVEKKRNQSIDFSDDDDEEEEEEESDDNYLQKFNSSLKTNVISEHHPELIVQNFHEVESLCTIVRDSDGIIIDPLHRTLPFVTKYEKAKVLGERAKQINAGAEAFVELGEEIIDGYLIAMAEFEQKKIPMIIRRPLPNGGSEFWRMADLELL
jgi:DNA-directed RNA polymerase I, II, and III subunit RPABC2